jgi:shikimate kinase
VEERVMRHVLIVGLPGAGKSKLLEMCRASLPAVACFDLDREIERELGLLPFGLTQWIINNSNVMDRQREFACLLRILQKNTENPCIISLGGGALDLCMEKQQVLSVLEPVDWIFLEAELETVLDHLMQDHSRPHSQMGNRAFWRAKLQKRMDYFSQLPQVRSSQDHSELLVVIEEIMRSGK